VIRAGERKTVLKFDLPDDNNSFIDIIKAIELRTDKSFEYSKFNLSFL
jgi:hypothetical protein